MRELDGRRMRTRVKGLAALRRRARALLIAAARFSRCRAATPREQEEAGRMIDALAALLDGAETIAGDPGAAAAERVNGAHGTYSSQAQTLG